MSAIQQFERKSKIRAGEPIDEPNTGLRFYPITMENYDEYLLCKDIISMRLSTLPVRYAVMSYASAIFAMEIDSIIQRGTPFGGLERLIRMLCLSLRERYDAENLFRFVKVKAEGKQFTLESVVLKQGETEAEITPRIISATIRPLIAEQNGIKLPDESENAEIIESYEMKKRLAGKINFDVNTDTLIASVAYASRISEREILSWTVREFENRRAAIDRDKRYMLYGQAELSGMVSFKDGNPVPSWCFDVKDDSAGMVALSEIQKTLSGAASPR